MNPILKNEICMRENFWRFLNCRLHKFCERMFRVLFLFFSFKLIRNKIIFRGIILEVTLSSRSMPQTSL